MRPVCQAERAAAHCVPPEQRTVAGPAADASGGGLTNRAKHVNKTENGFMLFLKSKFLYFLFLNVFLVRSD